MPPFYGSYSFFYPSSWFRRRAAQALQVKTLCMQKGCPGS